MAFVTDDPNGGDARLWRALRDVPIGFYIDIGASPAALNSITQAFYERGWRGINADPSPANVRILNAARPRDINLQLVVANKSGPATFYRSNGSRWSALTTDAIALNKVREPVPEESKATMQTLAGLCDEQVAGDIHFLRLSISGFEAEVITGGDFKRFRPWIVVVTTTATGAGEPDSKAWETLLAAMGYRLAYFDASSFYYVVDEHFVRLLPLLSASADNFDDCVADRQTEQAPNAALEAANRRADAGEQRATRAEARARAAELRILAQDTELHLLRAESSQMTSSPPLNELGIDPIGDGYSVSEPSAQRIFLDATLMLRHGFISAVGIVRVEHYVAEFLAKDTTVALQFVAYDQKHHAYRTVTPPERKLLERILFRRYRPVTTDCSRQPATNQTVKVADTAAESAVAGTTVAFEAVETSGIDPRSESTQTLSRRAPSGIYSRRWERLRMRCRLAASLTPAELTPVLNRLVLRQFPIKIEQSATRRACTRLLRRGLLSAGRASHRVVRAAAVMHRKLAGQVRRLTVPDPTTSDGIETVGPALNATPKEFEQAIPASPDVPDVDPFKPGDVLLCMANTWDYMDYRYLAKLGPEMGVRLISVVYDVVAMELPFVTPAPAHLYHRHWVEIGHASERLIAISRYTKESYDRFIARPNGIHIPVDHAPLPNFLRVRAAEIGECVVEALEGREFVVYCSTIEVRKNHVLLLHLWEELRQRIGPNRLPILVFVGKWGWSAEAVQLLAERNWRLRSHLRIMNDTSDAELIWLYRNAGFTVFPSLTEGFGLAAAESLSFGTPVVISHCPALLEATEHLMPALHPHDFMGWLRELERLILDAEYRAELKTAATQFSGPAYEVFAATIRDAALVAPGFCRSSSNPSSAMREGP